MQYQQLVRQGLQITNAYTVQEKWTRLVNTTKQAAIKVAGYKLRHSRQNNTAVATLSTKQKRLQG